MTQEDNFDLDRYERKVDRDSSDSEDHTNPDATGATTVRAKKTGAIRAIGKKKTQSLWSEALDSKKEGKEDLKMVNNTQTILNVARQSGSSAGDLGSSPTVRQESLNAQDTFKVPVKDTEPKEIQQPSTGLMRASSS